MNLNCYFTGYLYSRLLLEKMTVTALSLYTDESRLNSHFPSHIGLGLKIVAFLKIFRQFIFPPHTSPATLIDGPFYHYLPFNLA